MHNFENNLFYVFDGGGFELLSIICSYINKHQVQLQGYINYLHSLRKNKAGGCAALSKKCLDTKGIRKWG